MCGRVAFHIYQVSSSGNWTRWIDGTQFYRTATNTVGFTATPQLGISSQATSFRGAIAEFLAAVTGTAGW